MGMFALRHFTFVKVLPSIPQSHLSAGGVFNILFHPSFNIIQCVSFKNSGKYLFIKGNGPKWIGSRRVPTDLLNLYSFTSSEHFQWISFTVVRVGQCIYSLSTWKSLHSYAWSSHWERHCDLSLFLVMGAFLQDASLFHNYNLYYFFKCAIWLKVY